MKKWAVNFPNNEAATVEADSMEIDFYGSLIFYRDDETGRPVIIRGFAHGAWTEVERVAR